MNEEFNCGGKKQTIAARAVVENPQNYFNSTRQRGRWMHAESERIVQEALDGVTVNRTTVVNAHRLPQLKVLMSLL